MPKIKTRFVTVVDGPKRETFPVHLPHIRNIRGFLLGTWDFTLFNDAFPGTNRLGDVDGSIEIYGHTLHVEFKKDSGAMNGGQLVKAIRQAKYSNITTYFVFGPTNKPVELWVISPKNIDGFKVRLKNGVRDLNRYFRSWSNFARKNSLVGNPGEDFRHGEDILSRLK